jgi:hypothetical protein
MDDRQLAYRDLLHYGLLAVRSHAYSGQVELCGIEADHLHNIPSLLAEANEARHKYYIIQERSLYLERLKSFPEPDYLRFTRNRYSDSWKVLASIAGVDLSE